jgi:hypothetical protein
LGICSSEAYCVGAAGSSEECGITLTDVEDSPLPNPVSHYLPLYLWECNIRTNKGFNSALNQVDEFYTPSLQHTLYTSRCQHLLVLPLGAHQTLSVV